MDDLLPVIREYGLPIVVVALLVLEILVPRGRLKREEARGDLATQVSQQQVDATRELTAAFREFTQTVVRWMDDDRDRTRPTGRGR